MPVEILMPELGESVFEGTVTRWLKKEGDYVKEDEPVVEIMTDKVNTELQAPASGILSKILVPEGESAEVLKPMGYIDDKVGSPAAGAPTKSVSDSAPTSSVSAPATPSATEGPAPETSLETSGDRKWLTPVVRSIAKEQGLSEAQISQITGTGEGGRVTKKDVQAFIEANGASKKQAAQPIVQPVADKRPVLQERPVAPTVAGPDQEVVPLVGMRKMIADAMVRSSQVPTVSTVTQCDVTHMVHFREKNKETFLETYKVKLTYTPFFIKALTETLLEFPLLNASLQPDNKILMSKGVHVGVAVALGAKGDEGLIVPVIRDCHKKSLVEIAKDLEGIAKAARSNSLKPSDVQGGTFTITNPGTYGALFGTPMINSPQAGVLGTYAIIKSPVIVDDMIAIRSIMHLVLTYDHRLVDGLLAGRFLAAVRDRLQNFDFFK